MNIIDGIVLIVFCIGIVRGYHQGFIRALINFLGWLLAIFIAFEYTARIAPAMIAISHDVILQKMIASLFLVGLTVITCKFITSFCGNILNALHLGRINKFAGSLLGFFKYSFILIILLQFLDPFLHHIQFWKKSTVVSIVMPYLDHDITFQVDEVSKQHKHLEHVTQNPFR